MLSAREKSSGVLTLKKKFSAPGKSDNSAKEISRLSTSRNKWLAGGIILLFSNFSAAIKQRSTR
jgi:hypothetical protein